MNKLLKDAIADAKAVRETALANAKVALEEAFAPRLQSMLSHKIKEEMEEDEPLEGVESEEEESMETEGDMYEMDNGVEDDEEAHPVEEGDEEVVSAEVEVSDEGSDEEASAEAEEAEMSDDELEEILRELEGEEDSEEMDEMDHNAEDATDYDEVSEGEEEAEMAAEDEEEIDLEEIIKALREEDEEAAPEEEEAPAPEEDLEEAYKVIKYLRSKLNEVNLLNAKLLFVNKLFKKGELTENKKIKIIETFDRVRSVREAKLVYATLAESMTTRAPKKQAKRALKKRRSLKEGFASSSSKPTKKVIKESNNVYNRFSELVNYNK